MINIQKYDNLNEKLKIAIKENNKEKQKQIKKEMEKLLMN